MQYLVLFVCFGIAGICLYQADARPSQTRSLVFAVFGILSCLAGLYFFIRFSLHH